jgi:uncharacterized protein
MTFLLPIFFLIALLYAAVGFGGGSSYIAMLALQGGDVASIKFTALICNLIVVSNTCIQAFRKNLLVWKKVFPFILLSIPCSFASATMRIKDELYFKLLGISLIISAIMLFFQKDKMMNIQTKTQTTIWHGTLVGALIGSFSGILGIGGGIFLSPYLYFIRWDESKKINVLCSFFIFCNSLAALFPTYYKLNHTPQQFPLIYLSLMVFLGGQIGTYLSFSVLSPKVIRRLTAILIFIAGIEIIT